eukprot:GHVP01021117.1.p1 GENE.GHVP01021117.1~~GHVP01021117.1.p1  ORF type:complete len:132 (+),score=21.10 GHVP01021117.1:61-456(+)
MSEVTIEINPISAQVSFSNKGTTVVSETEKLSSGKTSSILRVFLERCENNFLKRDPELVTRLFKNINLSIFPNTAFNISARTTKNKGSLLATTINSISTTVLFGSLPCDGVLCAASLSVDKNGILKRIHLL